MNGAVGLKTSNLHCGQQQAETDDPCPIRDVPTDPDHSEVSEYRHEIKNQTYDPSDLFGSFSSASCHECLLRFLKVEFECTAGGFLPTEFCW